MASILDREIVQTRKTETIITDLYHFICNKVRANEARYHGKSNPPATVVYLFFLLQVAPMQSVRNRRQCRFWVECLAE